MRNRIHKCDQTGRALKGAWPATHGVNFRWNCLGVLLALSLGVLGCGSKPPAPTVKVESPPPPPKPDGTDPVIAVEEIDLKLVKIPAGQFAMGANDASATRDDDLDAEAQTPRPHEKPVHDVKITHPFYISEKEITVNQFGQFVKETGYETEAESDALGGEVWNAKTNKFERNTSTNWKNPGFPQTGDHPVVLVTYKDALAFTDWLSKKTGKTVRLPTEAEWEYAARAEDPSFQISSRWAFGDNRVDLPQFAWFKDNSDFATHPVGSTKPNDFGLYDVHGNAEEWVMDWFDPNFYGNSPPSDPKGPDFGAARVLRGGSFKSSPSQVASGTRNRAVPTARQNTNGFRVVREINPEPAPAPEAAPKDDAAAEKKS